MASGENEFDTPGVRGSKERKKKRKALHVVFANFHGIRCLTTAHFKLPSVRQVFRVSEYLITGSHALVRASCSTLLGTYHPAFYLPARGSSLLEYKQIK